MTNLRGTSDLGPRTSDDGGLAAILAQVRRIEIRTERLVSSLTAGRFRSAFKGTGMEFDEVREYTVGDDVRSIDWNVTARAGKPFVKVFREERELSVVLAVDVSGSMRFGAIPGVSPRAKLALAAEAAAVVGVTALKNGDRLGLVSFTDRTEIHLPPRRGRGHALRVIREVLVPPESPRSEVRGPRSPEEASSGWFGNFTGIRRHKTSDLGPRTSDGRATDLAHALDELVRVAKRRCVCFLISDFLHAPERQPAFATALARAARRHDLIGLRVADPAEAVLPTAGPLVLDDPEGGGSAVLATSKAAANRYAAAYQAARATTTKQFAAAGCDLVDLSTDRGAFTALQAYFGGRHG